MRVNAAPRFVRQQRDLWLGLAVVAAVSLVAFGPSNRIAAQTTGATPAGLYPRLTCVAPDPDNAGYYIATLGYENSTTSSQTVPPSLTDNYLAWTGGSTGFLQLASNSPSTFAQGLYPAKFAARFAFDDVLHWFLQDPSSSTLRELVVVAGSGPACVGFPGPPGPPGAAGPIGPTGPAGSAGPTGSTGPMGSTGPAGAGMTWRGPYVSSTNYMLADGVEFNGSGYLMTSSNGSISGIAPPNAPWQLFAAQGAVGLLGPAGPVGQQGAQGSQGLPGGPGPSGPAGPGGPNGPQGVPGAGMAWQGAYVNGTTYTNGDGVQFGGSSYRLTISGNVSTSSVPPPSAPWQLVASIGGVGAAGTNGAQGPQGPQGLTGLQGPAGIPGAGMQWRGPYLPGTSYAPADAVQFNGSSYRLSSAGGNVSAPPAAPWELVAAAGATGVGGGQAFSAVVVTTSGDLTLAGNASMLYVARPAAFTMATLTLPPAAAATSRTLTVRLDGDGQVLVAPRSGQSIVATRRTDSRVWLPNRFDYTTFASDGVAWYIVAESQSPGGQSAPSLTVLASPSSIRVGGAGALTATMTAGGTGPVDVYILIRTPAGAQLSVTQSGVVPGVVPYALAFAPVTGSIGLGSFTVPVGFPTGQYTVTAALTAPGTTQFIAPFSETVFTVTP